MKTTIDWLDAAKQQHDLSDYALAPLLGVTRSQLSRFHCNPPTTNQPLGVEVGASGEHTLTWGVPPHPPAPNPTGRTYSVLWVPLAAFSRRKADVSA